MGTIIEIVIGLVVVVFVYYVIKELVSIIVKKWPVVIWSVLDVEVTTRKWLIPRSQKGIGWEYGNSTNAVIRQYTIRIRNNYRRHPMETGPVSSKYPTCANIAQVW